MGRNSELSKSLLHTCRLCLLEGEMERGNFTTLNLSRCSNLQTFDAMLCELILQIVL